MDTFRVRLNCVDHYQAIPTTFDPNVPFAACDVQGKIRPKVPVIRVFGATEAGQKVCAHVHGAFPYLFIRYGGSLAPEDVSSYIETLQVSIDHALAISYRRRPDSEHAVFVAHITLVKGVQFYGFHVGYDFFTKIYLLNPLHMTRLADLLRQGAIMSKSFQPYESHMQYLAQWMCDYNLYGCAYIDCARPKFRSPLPIHANLDDDAQKWHDQSIEPSDILDADSYPKQSHCSIEIDVHVADILNRNDIKAREIHQDFSEQRILPTSGEKLVQSMAGLWRDETKRRKDRMGLKDPSSSPFPPEVLVSVSADPRNTQPGGWIHETEYRQKIDEVVLEEQGKGDGTKLTFENYVNQPQSGSMVQTTLQSVYDLYHENIQHTREAWRLTQQSSADNHPARGVPQVDESRLLSYLSDDPPLATEDNGIDTAPQIGHRNGDEPIAEATEYLATQDHAEDQADDQPCVTQKPTTYLGKSMSELSPADLVTLGVERIASRIRLNDAFEMNEDLLGDIDEERAVHNNSKPGPPAKRRRIDRATANAQRLAEAEISLYRRSIAESPRSTDVIDQPGGNKNSIPGSYKSEHLPQHTSGINRSLNVPSSFRDQSELMPIAHSKASERRDPATTNNSLALKYSSRHSTESMSSKNASSNHSKMKMSEVQRPTAPISPGAEQLMFKPSTELGRVCHSLRDSFNISSRRSISCFTTSPISSAMVSEDLGNSSLPAMIYQDAFYSRESDVPERTREYAGKEFRLESDSVSYLPSFKGGGSGGFADGLIKRSSHTDKETEDKDFSRRRKACNLRVWEIREGPPAYSDVERWCGSTLQTHSQIRSLVRTPFDSAKPDISQIDLATQKNKHGFKYSQNKKTSKARFENQYMSVMSLEIHVNTRGSFVPNPEEDEVCCIFWALQGDETNITANNRGTRSGIIILSLNEDVEMSIRHAVFADVVWESSELDMINRMVDIVRELDPDIITGYEVHGSSWGYLIERARLKFDYDLCDEFSRVKTDSHGRFGKEEDRWGFNHTSTIRVTGRHMINIWRAMRGELNLTQYTLENVVFQQCHRRVPHYEFANLTRWFRSEKPRDLAKVIDYFMSRVHLDLEILTRNELVPRTSEQARLLGVDFFSVFSRGSQFKVESLMFRIAKPENLLLPSPSRKQVGQQNALECLPLVMEPESSFFNSPLLVLDFQSLYPSIMIAYNYCYSTCLGRVVSWRGQNKMGFTDYHRQPRILELLCKDINVAPNGMMYVRPNVRKSLLAKMLGEILETRVMVKSGMKVDREDKSLQRLLNNRQLALKLIANVTYGYTSASFSGRMPCSEIADSIVQTGRETLEKAIALIHSVERWGADVVYGDTDSLFVYLKGRTKDEAFRIGQEIARTVTDMNPRPVKLKFEKVYFPCVLLAKKRYVGFKYESKDQKVPDFDAKGIETVRRDGTPSAQKMEEKALKILFRTADLSQVKHFFQDQCEKIMRGRVSIQDFCFAKEVKLGTYSDKGPPPPGALISTKKMLLDPRAEPQYGERVPYVVVAGGPGARLIDRCMPPEALLHDDNAELDAEYYINKHLIPPLERIFNLMGANVRQWYDEMPKFQRIRRVDVSAPPPGREAGSSKKTLESYMKSSSCLVCREKLEEETGICDRCAAQADQSLYDIQTRRLLQERKLAKLERVCRSCAGLPWGDEIRCDSKDCSVFYARCRQRARLHNVSSLMKPLKERLENASRHKDVAW